MQSDTTIRNIFAETTTVCFYQPLIICVKSYIYRQCKKKKKNHQTNLSLYQYLCQQDLCDQWVHQLFHPSCCLWLESPFGCFYVSRAKQILKQRDAGHKYAIMIGNEDQSIARHQEITHGNNLQTPLELYAISLMLNHLKESDRFNNIFLGVA